MNRTMMTALSAGIGAGMMYFFDPERGNRRRALVRDQVGHGAHKAARGLDVARRDAANRIRGMSAQASHLFGDREVPDEVLAQRVRSQLGRLVSHPGSIDVAVSDGAVILSGPILSHEIPQLLRRLERVRGVRAIDNQLTGFDEPGHIPGLQGGMEGAAGHAAEFLQARWSPAARMLAGLAGSAMTVMASGRRGTSRATMALAGLSLLARTTANRPFKNLVGVGAGPHAVDFRRSMNFGVPVERLYAVWSDFERFPEFMTYVRDVRRSGDNRWHWTVAGPLGTTVEWDAVVTADFPNRLLAWQTVPDSPVQQVGMVRFEETDSGSRADIMLSFNPVAGVAGNVIATLFGANPKREIMADLMRMKSFLETGKRPHDAARKEEAEDNQPGL